MKKTVHYRKSTCGLIEIGSGVLLQTLDHPGPNVTNWPRSDMGVFTSKVIRIGENGEFETLYTIYKSGEKFL